MSSFGQYDESKHARSSDGKFAAKSTSESEVDLSASTAATLQTEEPLERLSLQAHNKQMTGWTNPFERENTIVDTPYQRGSVWDDDKRRALMNSLMRGIPCGTVITNDRMASNWTQKSGPIGDGEPFRAVVDGRQRLETIYAWHDDELDVPASWFDADQVETTHETDDGPYVYRSELNDKGRRLTDNRCQLPESMAQVGTVQEEARLFRLVNGGGVAQTEETMANAAAVENS